jgi:glycosyltransferase involved in cell wall biosynthesis
MGKYYMTNKITDISIIIPCYNVEDYIADCLNSLINQSCLPKEIICIDDGSTDNTLLILQQYASKLSYIKIVQQSNLGVSVARNKGIEIASGNYILFIDSDDIININLFDEFATILNIEPNLDFFYFDYTSFQDSKAHLKSSQFSPTKPKFFKSGLDLFSYLLEKKNYSGVVWRYIFNQKLFNEKFIGKNHEDHLVSLSIISKAKSTYYLKNKDAYFHRVRSSSLSMQNIDYLYTNTLKNVLNKCITNIIELPLSEIAKRNYILVMNATYLESVLKSNKLQSKKEKESLIQELGLLKLLIRIYIDNKLNIFRNIPYILKFIKNYPCPMSTKQALLKCVITKQHPCLNIKSKFKQYSSLNKF